MSIILILNMKMVHTKRSNKYPELFANRQQNSIIYTVFTLFSSLNGSNGE